MSNYTNLIGNDDFLVENIPDVALWNETMVGMFTDSATSVTACLYIGRWWGEPTTLRQMLAFMLPGDRALLAKNYGRTPISRIPQAGGFLTLPLSDGRIRYTYDGPMELRSQSEVSANGMGTGPTVRVRFEIYFSSEMPIWDLHATDPHGEEQDLMFPGGHMEQLGKFNGWLEFGEERIEFKDATGNRDHSRGVRNWSTHQSHVWINGQFPSGWGFNCFRASIVGKPGFALNSAVVTKNGRHYAATIETDGLTHPGSDIWAPFDLTFKTEELGDIKVRVANIWNCYQLGMYEPADLYWGVPTGKPDPKAAWSLEQSGEFHCDGEVGFGHVERCNRDIIVDDHWRSMCTPQKVAR